MKFLSGHEGHIADYKETKDTAEITFCSSSGNTKLEILCYAEVRGKKPFLYQADLPILIEAHDPLSGERFVLFDESKHGYDAIFCCSYDESELKKREVKTIASAERIAAVLHYAIDYESEKDDFDFDSDGKVKTGEKTYDWEYAKANGIDWIVMFYVDSRGKKRKFLDLELA